MRIVAIILAAGKGTRMKMNLPKCAIPFLGKPMINHIIDQLVPLSLAKIIVVVGYQKDKVIELLPNDVIIVEQKEQLGTYHAVLSALPYIDANDKLLILPGDMPLVQTKELQKIIDSSKSSDLTVVGMNVVNPKGYGRVIKNKNGYNIIEELDASESERKVNLVNTGVYFLKAEIILKSINDIQNKNAQKEYYLTSIVAWTKPPYQTYLYVTNMPKYFSGINDYNTLKVLEKESQEGFL